MHLRKQRNFYSGVAEHDDISKLVLFLSSSVNSVRELATEFLQNFQKYNVLWTEDRDAKIQVSLMMITYRIVLHWFLSFEIRKHYIRRKHINS